MSKSMLKRERSRLQIRWNKGKQVSWHWSLKPIVPSELIA